MLAKPNVTVSSENGDDDDEESSENEEYGMDDTVKLVSQPHPIAIAKLPANNVEPPISNHVEPLVQSAHPTDAPPVEFIDWMGALGRSDLEKLLQNCEIDLALELDSIHRLYQSKRLPLL